MNEGTTWESLLFASFHNLNNLVIIIDYNKIQSLDYTKNVLQIEPLNKKLKSFGCKVRNIDGHNFRQIQSSLSASSKNKPYIIIANTIKGKGVKFMEDSVLWHYRSPSNEELKNALDNLK